MTQHIFHMGAHRCGSTAIQNLLKANARPLRRRGWQLYMPRTLAQHDQLYYATKMAGYHPLNPFVRKPAKGFISALSGMEKVILSDENMLGTMLGVKGFSFYPYAQRVFSILAKVERHLANRAKGVSGNTFRVALMARRQDRLVESIYAFRVTRGETMGFDQFVAKIDPNSLRWEGLLNAAVDAGFGGEIAVGLVEDMSVPKIADMLNVPLEGTLAGNASLSPVNVNFWLALVRLGVDLPFGPATRELITFLRQSPALPEQTAFSDRACQQGLTLDRAVIDQALDQAQALPLPLFDGETRSRLLANLAASNARFAERAGVPQLSQLWKLGAS